MEDLRNRFFNAKDKSEKKITWCAWKKVLASKSNGGLGVSSLFALNRALLLKWIWRFISNDNSLWRKVICSLYGTSILSHHTNFASNWCSILREVQALNQKGFDFWDHVSRRVGNGAATKFWTDHWIGDLPLFAKFPRLFALESTHNIDIASKIHSGITSSFRRQVRDGSERSQLTDLQALLESFTIADRNDRWVCKLSKDGDFKVKEFRTKLEELFLPSSSPTKWIKHVPAKVNIFMWRARKDCLPTRANLNIRGVDLPSLECPLCDNGNEDGLHCFFVCDMIKILSSKVCRWWDISYEQWQNFEEWQSWLSNLQFSSKSKSILEGVFAVMWWQIWNFRNRILFDEISPRRSEIFDSIVLTSFNWCKWRSHISISWTDWIKNPSLSLL